MRESAEDLFSADSCPAAEWAWRQQSIWSQTADKLKARPHRMWEVRLGLTVAAAALVLAGSHLKAVSLPASTVLAVGAALALAAVGGCRGRQNVGQIQRWTRARSVSEAIKTEMFLFLSQSGVYHKPDRERRLEAEVQRLENEAGDLQALKAAEVMLALVSAALAAMAATSSSVGAWAAVVTTGGGAVAAYVAAERYEFLWIQQTGTRSLAQNLLASASK